jgi:DNA polymerase
MMSPQTRRQYLAAMGITQWDARDRAAASVEAPTVNNTDAVSIVRISDAWQPLQQEVASCVKCELHKTRKNTVFGVGDTSARWMFIGEAPGADEDARGEPFVGRAGQLLNAMLFAMGLKREEVYIANVLKCRPPGNRDPQPGEVECCEPYLLRQISLIQPKLIVALGRHAAHSLLKTEMPLSRLRGQRHTYHGTPLVVTYHPAYLLRSPGEKRKAWTDLCMAMRAMQSS